MKKISMAFMATLMVSICTFSALTENDPVLDKDRKFMNPTMGSKTAFSVTPDDNTELSGDARALYIGGAGNIKLQLRDMASGSVVIFQGVPAGALLPVLPRRVYSTDTTATNIIGLE